MKHRCLLFALLLPLVGWTQTTEENTRNQLLEAQAALKNYDTLSSREVMVLGTFHFRKNVLEPKNQESLRQLIDKLKDYKPTKILVEWVPQRTTPTNKEYHGFLKDSLSISDKYNEVYQIGFRLAKALKHDSIYLFDDKTEYIGSLKQFAQDDDPFSFERFGAYAKSEDDGFFNKYEKELTEVFKHNLEKKESLSLRDHIALLNSPESQKANGQRMHMYEVRVGIQKNWSGPDWLGR